jgi:hypothetical protein
MKLLALIMYFYLLPAALTAILNLFGADTSFLQSFYSMNLALAVVSLFKNGKNS